MEWDDDEFTREPLDASKPPHSDSQSDERDPMDEPLPDDEFTREPLDTTRPAGGRTKHSTQRVLLTIGSCALLAIVLLVSTGTAANLWRQARFAWLIHTAPTLTRTTMAAQPPGKRTLPGGWRRLPTFSPPNSDFSWATPASNDPNTWYSCSATHTDTQGNEEDGPLTFWYSHDAGQHWSNVPIPHTSASYCDLAGAPDAPQRLAMMSQYYGSVPPQDAACSQLSLFLSKDGGAHWRAVPTLPDPPIQPGRRMNCTVTSWPTTRSLFLLYNYYVTAGADNHVEKHGSTLVRSDDNGQTWKNLDANLPPGSQDYPYIWPLDDGKTLLFQVERFEPATDSKPEHESAWLWVSRDAGDSWEPLANVDGFLVQTLLPMADARTFPPSPAHPLYLISEASVPSRLLRIQIAQARDLHHYAPLPPLPIAGASPEHLGITTVLTTTPSGKLLVFGLGPDGHIPTDSVLQTDDPQFAREWLWEWDPVASRWTLLTPPLDAPWPDGCSDHCWHGWIAPVQEMGVYLWVTGYGFNEAGHGSSNTFRVPYTP